MLSSVEDPPCRHDDALAKSREEGQCVLNNSLELLRKENSEGSERIG